MTDFELRFHHLKTIGTKSPAHLRAVLDREAAGIVDEPSAAMELGTAVHALHFGTQRVTCYPGPVRRGKEYEAFLAANGGSLIMAKADYERACRMAEALANHADAVRVLTGTRETTLRWSQMGVQCRATPDNHVPGALLTDLKTTRDAEPGWFERYAVRACYHGQMAWYRSGMACALKAAPKDIYIAAVESTAPYPVTVLRLTDRALEHGARMCSLWFERYLTCVQSGEWPAYVQSIVDLDVPDDDELIFADEEAA